MIANSSMTTLSVFGNLETIDSSSQLTLYKGVSYAAVIAGLQSFQLTEVHEFVNLDADVALREQAASGFASCAGHSKLIRAGHICGIEYCAMFQCASAVGATQRLVSGVWDCLGEFVVVLSFGCAFLDHDCLRSVRIKRARCLRLGRCARRNAAHVEHCVRRFPFRI